MTQQSVHSSPPRAPKELKTGSEDSLTHFLCPLMTFPDTGSHWLPWVYSPVSQASPPVLVRSIRLPGPTLAPNPRERIKHPGRVHHH